MLLKYEQNYNMYYIYSLQNTHVEITRLKRNKKG